MRILITGGSGFVGRRLCRELLTSGYQVVVLVRNLVRARRFLDNRVRIVEWQGPDKDIPAGAFDGVDGVINLAGESIGSGRWTKAKKNRILESRVQTTRAIVKALAKLEVKPGVLVSASAVGYYGPRQDEEITENASPGQDFLAGVCRAWEAEAYKAEEIGVRVATVRIGVVLGEGGALERMIPAFELYLGGPLGTGQQWFSWIHVDDLARMIRFIIENPGLQGPVNGTAPEPLTMGNFCTVLGRVMDKPSWLPVPAFVLRLALGEMAEMVLYGQRVLPRKALEAGFEFRYPSAEEALTAVLKR
ncbi:MAG: TIGR01777 family oxidoreductase [Clostridia bacterium]|nr:TIGR01777 family oxidoreductase [Clostridia bacterium]